MNVTVKTDKHFLIFKFIVHGFFFFFKRILHIYFLKLWMI